MKTFFLLLFSSLFFMSFQQVGYAVAPPAAPLSAMALDSGQDNYLTPYSAYKYILLEDYMYGDVPQIKTASPSTQVYAYENIAATRSGLTTTQEQHPSTGVLYSDAIANHPDWFLKKNGQNFTFCNYPTLWWMDIGNQAYRDKWIANVKAKVLADGFDGVYIDDANFLPGHCSNGQLEAYTDSAYGAAMRDFIIQAADQLHAAGIKTIMNAGTDPWATVPMGYAMQAAPHVDGFMREFWMHWGNTDNSVFVGAEWSSQIAQMQNVERVTNYIANTYPTSPSDTRAIRYGRANFLLVWSGRPGSASQSRPVGNYNPYTPDATADIGTPKAYRYQVGVAWRREYTAGTVIVNPGSSAQLVYLGNNYKTSSGKVVRNVTVQPGDSVVLYK